MVSKGTRSSVSRWNRKTLSGRRRKRTVAPVSYTHLDVYKRQEENNDIRLMAFTEDGTLRGDLVDSISAISSQTGSSITSNFRFAKGADTLSELSILWSQPTMEVDEESTTPENNLGTADSDVLMGVRFRMDNGTIGLIAPIQLAALEEQETTSKTIEAFDGWVQSDGSLKAVVLSTDVYKRQPMWAPWASLPSLGCWAS